MFIWWDICLGINLNLIHNSLWVDLKYPLTAGRKPLPAFQKPSYTWKKSLAASRLSSLSKNRGEYTGDSVWRCVLWSCTDKLVAFVIKSAAKVRCRHSLKMWVKHRNKFLLKTYTMCRQESHQLGFDEHPLRPFTWLIIAQDKFHWENTGSYPMAELITQP